MARKIIFWGVGALIAILAITGFIIDRNRDKAPVTGSSNATTPTGSGNQTPDAKTPSPTTNTASNDWLSPLGDPKARVTKLPFGIYVTPQNSPIMPQRFTGYHTGWDFEILPGEETTDVTVNAFCAGKLLRKQTADGYGGVVVQSCNLAGQAATVIYGHLSLSTVSADTGDRIKTGQPIGLLGANRSTDTDGERKHLHFDIHKGTNVDIKGYVQHQSELTNWIDPTMYLGAL